MTEPTAADLDQANRLLDLAPMGGTNALLRAVAAALAEAEARGEARVRAKVEALADEFDTGGVGRFTPGYAADRLRDAVALTRQPPPPPNPLLAATIDDNPARPLA